MVKKILSIKTSREIKNNFLQYLAMLAICALAVALFVGLIASYMKLDARANKIYSDGNIADLWVTTTGITNADKEKLDDLKSDYSFNYEERIWISSTVKCQGSSTAYLIVTKDENPTISKSVTGFDKNAVMVDEYFAEQIKAESGDSITVTVNAMTLNFTVGSIVTNPETSATSSVVKGAVFMSADIFQSAFDDYIHATQNPLLNRDFTSVFNYNQVLIDVENEKDTDNLKTSIKNYFEQKENFVYCFDRDTFSTCMTISSDIIQGEKMCYIFPVIFFIVSILVILTTVAQLINRERGQIGTLKGLGYKSSEIRNHYTSLSSIVILIGCFIGSIIGIALIPNVMGIKYDILYRLPNVLTPIPWLSIGVCALLFIAVTYIVCVLCCHNEIKMKPAESMSGSRSVKVKYKIKETKSKMPIAVKLAFRNIRLKKSRAVMVIIGIIGCCALLVSGFGITDTLNYSVDVELKYTMPFDVRVSYSYAYAGELKTEIENIDGVDRVETYKNTNCTAISTDKLKDSYFYVVGENSKIINGEASDDGFTVSNSLAQDLNVKVGDSLTIKFNNVEITKTVAKLIEGSVTRGIFITEKKIGAEADGLNPSAIMIYLKDGASQESVKTEVEKLDGVLSVTTMTEYRSFIDDVLSSVTLMTLTLKTFAILLAVVVLYNLIRLNFKERAIDIATMKVLGLNNFEILSSLILENMLLVTIGVIFGLCLGFPLMKLILEVNTTEMITFLYKLTPLSYVFSALGTLFTAMIINLLFGAFVRKTHITEALKAKE